MLIHHRQANIAKALGKKEIIKDGTIMKLGKNSRLSLLESVVYSSRRLSLLLLSYC
jgi:hypothetical protein